MSSHLNLLLYGSIFNYPVKYYLQHVQREPINIGRQLLTNCLVFKCHYCIPKCILYTFQYMCSQSFLLVSQPHYLDCSAHFV